MLLLLKLTLGAAIIITPPVPSPLVKIPSTTLRRDSGRTYYNAEEEVEKRRRELRKKIEIENSEIIAIVELTLRNFII